MKKLIEIQKELKAPKGQFNSFGKYNYRSCEDILEAVKPMCAERDLLLTLSDEVVLVGDRNYVKATAKLIDGEVSVTVNAYACEAPDKKGMDSAQITGAASSYARKYALNGLFLIDDTKDADTQDNSGSEVKYISKKQISTIKDYIDNFKEFDQEKFLQHFGVESLEKMPESVFNKAVIALDSKKKQEDKA